MSAKILNEKSTKSDVDTKQSFSIGLLKSCGKISSKFSHGIDRLFYR